MLLGLAFLFCSAPALASPPPVLEVKSPGGITAWLVRNQRLPLLSLRFAFRGGVECDPPDRQGLAVMTTGLLTQGAGAYNDQAFQNLLAANAIHMEIGAERDAIVGSLKTLRRSKDEAFRLLALALSKPRFDQEAFLRAQAQQLSALRAQIAKPSWQGRYALLQTIFAGHPYSYRSLGSSASVKAITRKDVAQFARQRMAKDNLEIVVVGDMEPGELAAALDRLFGGLPEKAADVSIKDAVWPEKAASVLVPREGTQTNVLFAAPMPRRSDKDWEATEVANYILGGGGFVSRLMKNVREEKGLTYGVGTGLAAMDKASALMGEMATDNAKTGEALDLLKKVWTDLYEKGASPQEVEAAKDYLSGSLPLALSSTDAAASVLLSLKRDGFDKNYLNRRVALIQKVTVEDVNRVLKKWFNPSDVTFALVGEPEGVASDERREQVKE